MQQGSGIITVGILFAAFMILANLNAFKIVAFWHLMLPAAIIFIPMSYVFDDILTEVYGFKVSRRVIWSALLANVIVVGGAVVTIYLPAAPFWHAQQAYHTVYSAVPRVFVASVLGYLIGEFVNSIILAKMKIRSQGKRLWQRLLCSTGIGVALDTIVFVHVAFLFSIPYPAIWHIFFTMYGIKLAYEILAMPVTYKVTAFLKRKEQIDVYDHHTRFNPFGWKV